MLLAGSCSIGDNTNEWNTIDQFDVASQRLDSALLRMKDTSLNQSTLVTDVVVTK